MNTTCTHPTTYPTDVTDDEWELVAAFVNHDPATGSPRSVCMRCVLNALLYIDKTGCRWNMLPRDLPNYGTVYYHFQHWKADGTLARLNTPLRRLLRVRYDRDPDPNVTMSDRPTGKTKEVGGEGSFQQGKPSKGRRRHILVDTLEPL